MVDQTPSHDRARKKQALPQSLTQDMATRVGISEQLMGDIESGRRNATPANLIEIAEALNCPIVALERKRRFNADDVHG